MNGGQSVHKPYLLPSHWTWVKLGDVHQILTGTTPSRRQEAYYGGQVPFVKPGDLEAGRYVCDAEESLSEAGSRQANLIPAGATLVVCIGSLGKSAYATVPVTTNQQINSLIPHKEVNPLFTYYYTQTPEFQCMLRDRAAITTIAIVNKRKVSEIPFPLPPLEEQAWIVEQIERQLYNLNQAEKLIGESMELLSCCRQQIIASLYPHKQESMPRDWQLIPFGQLVTECRTGLARSQEMQSFEKPFGYLRMNNLTPTKELDLTNLVRIDASRREVDLYQVKPGDFIFNTRNSWELVGKNAVFTESTDVPILLNNNLLRIRFREDVNPFYIHGFFQSIWGDAQLKRMKYATTNVAAIYAHQLFRMLIPLPPVEVQQQIVDDQENLLKRHKLVMASVPSASQLVELRQAILSTGFRGGRK